MAAMAWRVENGKVAHMHLAYGGMAGTPKRARRAEAALLGKAWDEANIRKAMQELSKDFTPLDDARASAQYRMKLAQNAILRAFEEG